MKLYFLAGLTFVSMAAASDLAVLGQLSFSDWSLEQLSTPFYSIDFEEGRSSFSGVLQWTRPVGPCLDAGVELDVMSFSQLSWEQIDDGHLKTRDVSEYGGGVFLSAGLNRSHFSPYLKLVPGLYSQRMEWVNSTAGYPAYEGTDATALHFSLGILAGADISLGDRWGVRLEGGRYFLRRQDFPSYYVRSVDRLDSWKVRTGVYFVPGSQHR